MVSVLKLREAQQRILEYSGGYMGVSAVPGSGKTFTLSLLAAKLVGELSAGSVFDENEVLIVTFTNSAVENFRSRIATFLREQQGLIAGVGYRVRTLHGLAHDIVRDRPALAGLSEDFSIADARTTGDIMAEVTQSYLRNNPDALTPFFDPTYIRNNRIQERRLQTDALSIATAVSREIKDRQLDVQDLRLRLQQQSGRWPLLDLGLQVYEEYQHSLTLRGALDFDDLISMALRVLESDEEYLHRVQDRWRYVLEDEAQDSGALQERLLRLITRRHGNWVRVGDPNQAINTTFTSASTSYLRRFISEQPEKSRELPVSGRCALPILELANELIDWSREEHSLLPTEEALALPHMRPTLQGDPQQNPPIGDDGIQLFDRQLSPDQEVGILVQSLARWLPQHPNQTVAVLALTMRHVTRIADALRSAGLPVDDSLMRSSSETRDVVSALSTLLKFLSHPDTANNLNHVWVQTWWRYKGVRIARGFKDVDGSAANTVVDGYYDETEQPEPVLIFGKALAQLRQPEDFLFPAEVDWTEILQWMNDMDGFAQIVDRFRDDLQRWTQASVLPIEEMLLTIGADLFEKPAHLALTHHLAVRLASIMRDDTRLRLSDMADELDYIARNRRQMPDFDTDEIGYEAKPGVITLANMHKSKGLEWDRVYLTSVNTFDYPSGSQDEEYMGQVYYARNRLNFEAEALSQISQLAMGTLDDYAEEVATRQARVDTAAERLRLLYVGVTRARRELIVTYNTGRGFEKRPLHPAVAFQALIERTSK